MPDLAKASLSLAVPLFLLAAAVACVAGVKITRYANIIGERTGLGPALAGFLLLGSMTSLPELTVAVTSAASGATALATNGLLGGIALQVAALALADMAIGRRALTHFVPDPAVFLQAGLSILLLTLVAAATLVGDRPLLGAGLWSWLLLLATAASIWTLTHAGEAPNWQPQHPQITIEAEERRAARLAERDRDKSLGWAIRSAVAAALAIVAAGYVLSRCGDAIATQTGLGQSFVGMVLLAITTSLADFSIVLTAMRAGLYTMAMADIFGTNIIDAGYLFVVDLLDGEGAALSEGGAFGGFAALLGIAVTALFVTGLAERRNRTVLRMGYDSAAVLATYLAGLAVLYFLREGGGG